ncbi:MAG: rod shape-determining protein MreD [Arenimonas sp.]
MIRAPTLWIIYGSFFLGLVWAVIPLPEAMQAARPYLLAMFLVYWLMEAPLSVGLGTAFVVGLLADLSSASLLGEQAVRLVIVAFLVQRFRARLRFFPLWQQAITVGLLLLNDRIVVTLMHLLASAPLAPWSSLLAPVVALVVWPWLFVLLDLARLRARERN